jgi:hypothetical protein
MPSYSGTCGWRVNGRLVRALDQAIQVVEHDLRQVFEDAGAVDEVGAFGERGTLGVASMLGSQALVMLRHASVVGPQRSPVVRDFVKVAPSPKVITTVKTTQRAALGVSGQSCSSSCLLPSASGCR